MTSVSHRSADPTPPQGPPESVLVSIEAHLRQREERREDLHQRARQLRRLAQSVMIRIHEGRPFESELTDLRQRTSDLTGWLEHDGRADRGLAQDALQESVEASLLAAVVLARPLPGPSELGVEPEVYLLGLGDLVGEVRRLTLDRLAQGDISGARAYVVLMESLFHTLLRFDTTRAIVALKPKQDTARALLERTRGEVTMAEVMARISAPTRGTPGAPS